MTCSDLNTLIQECIQKHKEGVSLNKLQEEYNLPRARLSKEMKAVGYIPTRRFSQLDNLEALIKEYVESGKTISLSSLGEKYGICPNTITKYLKNGDIKTGQVLDSNYNPDYYHFFYLTNYLSVENIHNFPCKGKVKTNPFYPINTDEAQYWIGYLAGDGSLYKGKRNSYYTSLNSIDLEVMEQFKEFLGDVSINRFKYNSGYRSRSPLYNISFSNRNIYTYLNTIGITPNKTHSLELKVPLSFSFIRGIFDSDGCITKARNNSIFVRIGTASEIFANQIKTFLLEWGILAKVRRRMDKDSFYEVCISHKENIRRLYCYMYGNDPKYFLKRKRVKFEM